jgi:hypothetical protein
MTNKSTICFKDIHLKRMRTDKKILDGSDMSRTFWKIISRDIMGKCPT